MVLLHRGRRASNIKSFSTGRKWWPRCRRTCKDCGSHREEWEEEWGREDFQSLQFADTAVGFGFLLEQWKAAAETGKMLESSKQLNPWHCSASSFLQIQNIHIFCPLPVKSWNTCFRFGQIYNTCCRFGLQMSFFYCVLISVINEYSWLSGASFNKSTCSIVPIISLCYLKSRAEEVQLLKCVDAQWVVWWQYFTKHIDAQPIFNGKVLPGFGTGTYDTELFYNCTTPVRRRA